MFFDQYLMISTFIMYALVVAGAGVSGCYFLAEYALWRRHQAKEAKRYNVPRK
jgi:hypothetical protein